MVSNKELKERLRETRSGSNIKGYLVCDTCNGSYKLKTGENPEDYSSECECGGKLIYNRNITSNKNTKLLNIILIGLAFFVITIVIASFLFPLIVLGIWSSQQAVTSNNGNSQDYDQLNNLETSYDSLENQYQVLGSRVNKSNATVKSAYANAELQLENTNTTISNVNSALASHSSQSEVNKRINTAQAQLLIAQKSLNNVTSTM